MGLKERIQKLKESNLSHKVPRETAIESDTKIHNELAPSETVATVLSSQGAVTQTQSLADRGLRALAFFGGMEEIKDHVEAPKKEGTEQLKFEKNTDLPCAQSTMHADADPWDFEHPLKAPRHKARPGKSGRDVVLDNQEDERVSRNPPKKRKRRSEEFLAGDKQTFLGQLLISEGEDKAIGNPLVACNDDLLLHVNENGSRVPCLELVVPNTINQFLKNYQRRGIKFLFRQYSLGTGAILADDMGLGKTIQTIGFLAAVLTKTGSADVDKQRPARRLPLPNIKAPRDGAQVMSSLEYAPHYSGGPILIVCPNSLIGNWQDELDKWGTFSWASFTGTNKESALAQIISCEKEILIMSKESLMRRIEDLAIIPWHLVIVDEAHCLKNDKSQTWQAADRLPTRLRFGLTGTPQSNDYGELYCLLQWAVPGCLGDKERFKNSIEHPMKLGHRTTSTADEIEGAARAQTILREILDRYVLRRTKELIKHELPMKHDLIVFVELAPLQRAAYRRLVTSPDVLLLLNAREACRCGSGEMAYKCCEWSLTYDQGGVLFPLYHDCQCEKEDCKFHKMPDGCTSANSGARSCPFCLALPICTILRKVANHLELVKVDKELERTDPIEYYKKKQIAELVLGADADDEMVGGYVSCNDFLKLSHTGTCGKLAALKTLLRTWYSAPGQRNKVLLFSNSMRMLKIVEALLKVEGYDYKSLTGSIPGDARKGLVDSFNTGGDFIFLISTMAGGVGLNLTSANKVIIMDPSWNPAADLQAMDRAFRLGQIRDVEVLRFVAKDTLEELIYSRQISKQQHANMALEGTSQKRIFEGAKGMKGMEGELWGLVNMLKFNYIEYSGKKGGNLRDSALPTTMRLVERGLQGKEESEIAPGLQVEAFDAEIFDKETQPPAVVCQRKGVDGDHAKDDGCDVGLEALLSKTTGPPPSMMSDPMAPDEDRLDVQARSKCLGVVGVMRHEKTVGGHTRENNQKERSRKVDGGYADAPVYMTLLESLADFMQVDVKKAASKLLGSTVEQRRALLEDYVAAETIHH